MEFDKFFQNAAGVEPYGYQRRIAEAGLPAAVQVPTGCGKTGIILAWLWRRLYGPDRAATSRRLIYALPQRGLVEQVAAQTEQWLSALGLSDEVALHVVMGGAGHSQRQWRLDMHRPAIVIGTVDSLVSKALNRGYGIARAIYPIDFALATNGAHWVIDEVQLCPESTTTLRQVAAFARSFGTAEPFGLTCMSATIPQSLLGTVDNPAPGLDEVLQIEPSERTGELERRLAAQRTVRHLMADPGDSKEVATVARSSHRAGSLTLVVLNTVKAAQEVYRQLRGGPVPCVLLHSRFRAHERQQLVRQVIAEPSVAGRIVVSTQVVEAGIDLNAAILITEAAPWPSIVQRAGRCNRTGLVDDAVLYWVAPASHHPYLEGDVAAAVAELEALQGAAVSGEAMLRRKVAVSETPVAVLRKPDLVGLFDTSPDLNGADLDIAPYVRDAEDLDAQLAWAMWTSEAGVSDGRPPADAKAPGAEWRCRVPLREVAAMVDRKIAVWRLDQAAGRWTKLSRNDRARPGEVLVVAASEGGYDPELGFSSAARGPVPDSPVMLTVADLASGTEDVFGADSASVAQPEWVSLRQHSEDTRAQAEALLTAIASALPAEQQRAVVLAAYLHDLGKAHPTWQKALCSLAPDGDRWEHPDGPWAKSGIDGALRFEGGGTFRHELASLLLVDGPMRGRLAEVADPDLVRYLILAHHGRLRIQVREPDQADQDILLGLRQGAHWPVPALLGSPPADLIVDLGQFTLGGDRSWTRTALTLRDRYGPFVLAHLETVVRIADWRASAGEDLAS